MFTYFTDRDGKFQLASLAESGFDPLARTCQFMLKEEAHHMFVGAGGVGRVVQRTAELMREHDTDDVAPYGGINLDTLQRYLNLHYSVSLDLFGAETSTNAANYFAAGLKGRFQESRPTPTTTACTTRSRERSGAGRRPDRGPDGAGPVGAQCGLARRLHRTTARRVSTAGTGRWRRSACSSASPMWASTGGSGRSAARRVTPDGQLVTAAEWAARRDEWLPTDADRAHVDVRDAAGHGARPDGRLAGAALQRHPHQAGRVRVRPVLSTRSMPPEWLVDRHVEAGRGEDVAFWCEDRQLTYAGLQRATWAAAGQLASMGVGAGDRVLMVVARRAGVPGGVPRRAADRGRAGAGVDDAAGGMTWRLWPRIRRPSRSWLGPATSGPARSGGGRPWGH